MKAVNQDILDFVERNLIILSATTVLVCVTIYAVTIDDSGLVNTIVVAVLAFLFSAKKLGNTNAGIKARRKQI